MLALILRGILFWGEDLFFLALFPAIFILKKLCISFGKLCIKLCIMVLLFFHLDGLIHPILKQLKIKYKKLY